MAFQLLVLGAAAGGGLPQWNCAAANSSLVWQSDLSAAIGTQSSVAVGVAGQWTLLNASPDIRHQILAQPKLHPTAAPGPAARRSPITNVLLTDGDLDHIVGLLSLRERTPFNLLATRATLTVLAANPVFDSLASDVVSRTAIELDHWFDLSGPVRARLFAVPGKVPLYLEHAGVTPVTDEVTESTVGVELTDGKATAFYIPSCAKLTPDLTSRLHGSDLVLFDGTLFDDDELIRLGVGEKTGRRMGHMPMSGDGGSLLAFRDISIRRKLYIHMNNTNPVWREDSVQRRLVEAEGWEIAFDGLEMSL
ncbi:MAG: pyrroloquinoline quinone biosynthesis protein PqqB [Pseudomonadota bacterium]